jgi:hypothetical protein
MTEPEQRAAEIIASISNELKAAEEKAAAAEEALRDIALFLSCGGYNDKGLVEFDPVYYAKKIMETITHDQKIILDLLEKSNFPKTDRILC